MNEEEKSVLTEVAGDLDISADGSQCRIEVSATDGTPLTAQIILDAVSDMLMHYFSLDDSYWKAGTPEDEDLDS
jgi:hypothetical protein